MKSKAKHQVCVFLPNKQRLDCSSGLKSRGQDLLSEVLEQLEISGLQIFGLAILRDNEYLFIDLEQKLSKYLGQRWTKAPKMGPSILFLRVQYYLDSGRLIQSGRELRLYYTALRQKVLRSQSRQQEDLFFQLASHALQAEVGDFEIQGKHKHYFLPEDYFPSWLIKKRGRNYLLQHSPKLHEELRGLPKREALLEFVKLANTVEDVPVTLYKMRQNKKEQKFSIIFGVWSNGVCLYQGCRFEIHAVGSLCLPKLVFHSQSALHSALVLKHLRNSHRFTISVRDALSHVRQMEQIQACCLYREAYICDTALLMQKLHCSMPSSTDGSIELETVTEEEEEQNCEEDLSVQESEEVFVDSPDDVLWLAELLSEVSVDGPLVLPTSAWTAVTMEMKQVLKKKSDIGISVD
ncbi:FERM domain-containing protein 1 isoform X2 [Periophthalmus magnuspinnatus]|uniref:FERM domain-containing protein 1 isoform X2 n=1 Tax=Periophthalmus magnuspinnatus TaxID=409849 RepID=UPI0024371692|nr:FERM domain-containing protein 1 isoform X2 [Periophthalmus magnuspinnatus]